MGKNKEEGLSKCSVAEQGVRLGVGFREEEGVVMAFS